MARFTGGAHDAQSIRDLLWSVELIACGIAALLFAGVWAASGWLASDWLKAGSLPVSVVAQALKVMGSVIALRFVEDLYVSSLAGLQLQVRQNVVTSIMATLRSAGVIGVLAWISPTIQAFFMWQGLVSLATVVVFVFVVRHALPRASRPARMSLVALKDIRRFATGMVTITCLSLLLNQVDKVLLSRLLTLKTYGYYALAAAVAGGLSILPGPVSAAFYPKFTVLITRGDVAPLSLAYHQSAQLITVMMGSAALVLIAFHHTVLLLWTGDAAIAQATAPLMAVMALGILLNGLLWIPFQLQLAYGWTRLGVIAHCISASILVPAILWTVPRYGAIGAAWITVTLNGAYILIVISVMHRRILPRDKWPWYRNDIAMPLAAGAATVLICRELIPDLPGKTGQLGALVITAICTLSASALAAPEVRRQLLRYIPRIFGPLSSSKIARESV
jgi:O-antigen/teichoic acid export membrane protein